jgi:hypothetical protein
MAYGAFAETKSRYRDLEELVDYREYEGEWTAWFEENWLKPRLIRVLRFNSKRSDGVGRKVPQVDRHDDVCMAANRSRQHVPVIWIGELQTGNQILVACHERIDSVLVHQYASAFQLVSRKVRALLKQTGNPFLVDVRRPFRTK